MVGPLTLSLIDWKELAGLTSGLVMHVSPAPLPAGPITTQSFTHFSDVLTGTPVGWQLGGVSETANAPLPPHTPAERKELFRSNEMVNRCKNSHS